MQSLRSICPDYLTSTAKMNFLLTESCPETFKDWSNRARVKCTRTDRYHCVEDEVSRIVEVCVDSVWIEKGIVRALVCC